MPDDEMEEAMADAWRQGIEFTLLGTTQACFARLAYALSALGSATMGEFLAYIKSL